MKYKSICPKNHNKMIVKDCLYRCNMILGDLSRYREISGHEQRNNFYTAIKHYEEAIRIDFEKARPHNQIAVLSNLQNRDLIAFYQYAYAIHANDIPDITNLSVKNLTALMHNVIKKDISPLLKNAPSCNISESHTFDNLTNQNSHHTDKRTNSSQCRQVLEDFISRFLYLHGIILTLNCHKTEFNQFEKYLSFAVLEFSFLIKKSAVSLFFNLQIVVCLIYSILKCLPDMRRYAFDMAYQIIGVFCKELSFNQAQIEFLSKTKHSVQHFRKSSNRFSLLVPISIFFQFLEFNSKNFDTLWLDLEVAQSMLKSMINYYPKLLTLANLYLKKDNNERLALWDEQELRGFIPLWINNASRGINFDREKPKKNYIYESYDADCIRAQKICYFLASLVQTYTHIPFNIS